jgi:hypothetical protein
MVALLLHIPRYSLVAEERTCLQHCESEWLNAFPLCVSNADCKVQKHAGFGRIQKYHCCRSVVFLGIQIFSRTF